MSRLHYPIMALMLLGILPVRTAAADIPLLEVLVTYQQDDPYLPWLRQNPEQRSGYGIMVQPNRILTTAALIADHRVIEVRQPRSGRKIPVQVHAVDPFVNMALLSLPPDNPLATLTPVPLSKSLTVNTPLTIVQLDDTSEIQQGKAQPYKVTVDSISERPGLFLVFHLLTDLNVNRSSAPVMAADGLAGLVLHYTPTARTAILLPLPLISRFIAEADQAPYAGFANAGMLWTPLVDPDKRSFLGAADRPEDGILLLGTAPASGASRSLMPDDVILSIAGTRIDHMGFYEDPTYGRLAFPHLINGHHRPGNTLPMEIIRQHKTMTVNITLDVPDDSAMLIPEDYGTQPVEYLVEGGFIFRELTGRYLRARGGQWERNNHPRLVHWYNTRRFTPEKTGDRIIILSAILPDPINEGYRHFRDSVVTHVNSQSVRNMADIFRIQAEDGGITRVRLLNIPLELVLDKESLATANQRLADSFRIPVLMHRNPSLTAYDNP